MDYTGMTLGELLSSPHETIKRNAVSILKQLQKEKPQRQEYFVITRVHRDDLKDRGFKAENVEDSVMRRLASKMSDAYLENSFWIDLEIIAEYLEIPKEK